jgi:hypothetical protein
MWPCIVTHFFIIKPTDALISHIYFVKDSTCFGQFLCPSSGVLHCTFGTGICHAGLMTDFKHDQDGSPWKSVRLLVLLERNFWQSFAIETATKCWGSLSFSKTLQLEIHENYKCRYNIMPLTYFGTRNMSLSMKINNLDVFWQSIPRLALHFSCLRNRSSCSHDIVWLYLREKRLM